MPSTETVEAFLKRCRERIDEELDPEHNLVTQHELLEYTNEGMREVHQTIRETHEGWFQRTLRSDGEPINVGGRSYDPAELRFESGKAELRLPPDFQELLLFESLTSDDATRSGLELTFQKVTSPAFRRNVQQDATASSRCFFYDLEHRNDGWVMVFAPTPTVEANIDVMLKYVQAPPQAVRGGSFEDSGFEPFMLDAVLRYVVFCARNKEEEGGQAAANALGLFDRKNNLAGRIAGPKQSRDVEVVQGVWDDDEEI